MRRGRLQSDARGLHANERRAGGGALAPGQRWSVARKRAVVLRLIAGEPVELVSREIGVPVFKLERWRE